MRSARVNELVWTLIKWAGGNVPDWDMSEEFSDIEVIEGCLEL